MIQIREQPVRHVERGGGDAEQKLSEADARLGKLIARDERGAVEIRQTHALTLQHSESGARVAYASRNEDRIARTRALAADHASGGDSPEAVIDSVSGPEVAVVSPPLKLTARSASGRPRAQRQIAPATRRDPRRQRQTKQIVLGQGTFGGEVG